MTARIALLLSVLAGCLEVPTGPGQECRASSDCDTGEVCQEGLCWGAPPMGVFAATISAPSTREELVASELAILDIPQDGWLGDLQLETPVTISGRVEAYCPSSSNNCDTDSIAASVRFTRPSRFPGGPALRFSSESKADVPRGSDSFTIRVPRTQPGDEPYVVTIDPAGGGEIPPSHGGSDPAELVPPRRLVLDATDDLEHQTYTLGGPSPIVITGYLKDALAQPLVGYRVAALGRWDAGSTPSEVSTVDFATDGTYSITIAEGALGPLEIIATPYGSNDVAPELHVFGVTVESQQRNLGQPSGLGQPVEITLPVQALAGNGEVKMVSGVRVSVTGLIDPMFTGGVRAHFTAEATTGEDGVARLFLLDGETIASSYRLRAVPPASSTFGVLYDEPFELGGTVEPLRLPSRVALRGTVTDVHGSPLAAVSVTARRSLRFLWSVARQDQAFLDEIPASTAITPDSGEFVVWVDPAVANAWGHYDLFFETASGSHAPNWTLSDLEVPRLNSQLTVSLDDVRIPDAARIHGRIVDAEGRPVEGSALRVFQVVSNELICREVGYEPSECQPASLVMGAGETDARGHFRLSLPRP